MTPMIFSVSDEWKKAYPDAHAGILALDNVRNPSAHAALEQRKQALENRLREQFGGRDSKVIETLPTIQAYNAYYRRFKKNYHVQAQLESVALKGKHIPTVAALVEAMFMAELKNQLLTAGHDLANLRLPLTLDVANGNEHYTLLRGSDQVTKAGDMLMGDAEGIVSSILYGPDQRTKITAETRAALFAVYAPSGIPVDSVEQHLQEIRDLVLIVSPEAQTQVLQVYGAE